MLKFGRALNRLAAADPAAARPPATGANGLCTGLPNGGRLKNGKRAGRV